MHFPWRCVMLFPSFLPLIPMKDMLYWSTGCWFEGRSKCVGNGQKCCLRNLVIGDTQNFGSFFLIIKVEGGPCRSQASCTCGQHETPGGRQNRSPATGLIPAG